MWTAGGMHRSQTALRVKRWLFVCVSWGPKVFSNGPGKVRISELHFRQLCGELLKERGDLRIQLRD